MCAQIELRMLIDLRMHNSAG